MNAAPVVIEEMTTDKAVWILSFGGSNPKDECIELTKDQCFWLRKQIMSIDPSLLRQTTEICLCPK